MAEWAELILWLIVLIILVASVCSLLWIGIRRDSGSYDRKCVWRINPDKLAENDRRETKAEEADGSGKKQ